jgi:hypothetical protein
LNPTGFKPQFKRCQKSPKLANYFHIGELVETLIGYELKAIQGEILPSVMTSGMESDNS